jgi:2-polyprenyl-3-methyl-5-hydroxy-6-metoxy-1,4-benzoquinol methylase
MININYTDSFPIIRKIESSYFFLSHTKIKLENPWTLPQTDAPSALSVQRTLEFLTSMEADLALKKYNDFLCLGGTLEVSVPDFDFFIERWQSSDWSNAELKSANSNARQAFAGIWGEQKKGNPLSDDYTPNTTDVYKSGYNEKRLSFLLSRAGFSDIRVLTQEKGTLVIRGVKTMDRRERQIVEKVEDVRPDHLNRYEFACEKLSGLQQGQLLDLACGVGYGTKMLADRLGLPVIGADVNESAIFHAKRYFSNTLTEFMLADAEKLEFEESTFDAIVSFETIEHIQFSEFLIGQFYRWLKPGGYFICSTPNQDVMPFDKDKFHYHVKHYTNNELLKLLKQSGFHEISLYAQKDPVNGAVVDGDNGHFTIAVSRK